MGGPSRLMMFASDQSTRLGSAGASASRLGSAGASPSRLTPLLRRLGLLLEAVLGQRLGELDIDLFTEHHAGLDVVSFAFVIADQPPFDGDFVPLACQIKVTRLE